MSYCGTYVHLFVQGESAYISLDVTSCHPGYRRGRGGLCECDTDNPDILRCDTTGRYFFVRVSAGYIEFACSIMIKNYILYVHYNDVYTYLYKYIYSIPSTYVHILNVPKQGTYTYVMYCNMMMFICKLINIGKEQNEFDAYVQRTALSVYTGTGLDS